MIKRWAVSGFVLGLVLSACAQAGPAFKAGRAEHGRLEQVGRASLPAGADQKLAALAADLPAAHRRLRLVQDTDWEAVTSGGVEIEDEGC